MLRCGAPLGRTVARTKVVSEALSTMNKVARASASAQQQPGPILPSMNAWSDPAVYSATRRPIDEAFTLPGSVYHDEEFFKLERDRVFKSSWVAVAELCDIANPGDIIPANVGGSPIILANDKGTIRAFHNVCRHRGARLVKEKCTKRRTILCPYHRWGYALDGRLLAMPAFDDEASGKKLPEHIRETFSTKHVKDFDKEANGLFPVRVETFLGLAFVNLNAEAPPLKEWLGDLVPALADYDESLGASGPGLHPVARKTYDVAANWKVLLENYLEYYHLPAVHPELCNVSGVDEHVRKQGKGMYMGFATEPLSRGGTPIDPGRLPPFPTLHAWHTEMAYHIAIFPNTFFSLYPDAFFRIVLNPSSAERTIEHATLLTHKGALEAEDAEAKLKETFEFWDLINSQDIEICENVQQGTSVDAYQGGRFSFRFEEPVHRFQNMIIDKMLTGVEDKAPYHIPEGDDTYDPLHNQATRAKAR